MHIEEYIAARVKELCEKYHMDMREIREWYDGYRFENCEPVYAGMTGILLKMGCRYTVPVQLSAACGLGR